MTMLQRTVLVSAFAVVGLAPAAAQVIKSDGPKPQFEVATVRPNKSGEQGAQLGPRPGGRLIGVNQPVRNLIRNAFNVQSDQIIGGPDWIESDRFDIQAKAADADLNEKGMLSYPQFMLRLQSLLEDRFKMVTHWETRERPVYALRVVSPGKLGPKMKPHTRECNKPPAGPPPPGSPAVKCGTSVNPTAGRVTGIGITMATFARNLSGVTARFVVEKTNLTGAYDLELEFTPDQSANTVGPSLFTAMQEQLGLKLDAQRAPIEVLVIDRVERPTAD
jgi:uncharacterized protein (TIGR03435 family)